MTTQKQNSSSLLNNVDAVLIRSEQEKTEKWVELVAINVAQNLKLLFKSYMFTVKAWGSNYN